MQERPSLELSHQGRRGQPGRSRPGKLPLAHSTHIRVRHLRRAVVAARGWLEAVPLHPLRLPLVFARSREVGWHQPRRSLPLLLRLLEREVLGRAVLPARADLLLCIYRLRTSSIEWRLGLHGYWRELHYNDGRRLDWRRRLFHSCAVSGCNLCRAELRADGKIPRVRLQMERGSHHSCVWAC